MSAALQAILEHPDFPQRLAWWREDIGPEQAIIKEFAKHGETVEVSWDDQDVGGVTPWGLKTRVDGETDHEDCEFVDTITGDVWMEFKWIVEKA